LIGFGLGLFAENHGKGPMPIEEH